MNQCIEYTLENCSYYRKMVIGSTPVYIFEDHNMALPVWGTFASKFGALHLISFDTHTDTHPAFTKFMGEEKTDYDPKRVLAIPKVKKLLDGMRYKKEDFCFEDIFRFSMTEMFNTEQILTGVIFGYLLSYTVRTHRDNYENDDRRFGYDATYLVDSDQSIPKIRVPLFLDIDLDFFREESEINQHFSTFIAPYVRIAKGITIAREPRFFNAEKFDSEFTVDQAEEKLISLLSSVVSPK